MCCVSQKNAMPAAASRSASQTTENGRCVTSRVDTTSGATLRSSHALPKFLARLNTGVFISLHVPRSTCARSDANASLICQKLRMRFTLTRTFHGEKIRFSRWSSDLTKTESMRCTRATTSKFDNSFF